MNRAYIALGLIALWAPSQMIEAKNADPVEVVAKRAMIETGAQGLAIAVVENGRVKSVQAFGSRNAAGAPLTVDTVMYGASLTKSVFGYLATQLAQEKTLQLDVPIANMLSRPLPNYGNLDAYGNWGDLADDPRWKLITPRMVLNHSTGFANFSFLEPDQKLRIHFTPGSRYAYSGEGIMLLQFALERGSALDVGRELQSRFFDPLGMRNTSLVWRPSFSENVADGWDELGKVEPHDERSRVRAAGSMDTTIADFAVMTAAIVRGYGLKPKWRKEFAKGTRTITTAQQFPTLLPDAESDARPSAAAGLGVISFSGPQGAGWYKGGHNDTTANTLVCLERRKNCVLILSNDVRAERAFPMLVRSILGDTGVPYRWEYPGLANY